MTGALTGNPSTTVLAASEDLAATLGRLSIPFAGLILIVLGIVYLIRSRTPKAPPGYSPPQAWPQPYPAPGQPPLPPGYYPPPPGYYPPPPDPYSYANYSPPPAVKRTSRKTTGTVLLVIGGLIVFGSLASATTRLSRERDALAVGNCAAEVGDSPSDFTPISCDDPTAVVEIAAHSETNTCPDGKSAGSHESDYGSATKGSTTYCFIPNLQQGRCYTLDVAGGKIAPADCSAARAVRIAKRVDGSTYGAVCAADTKALVFPKPARVYCFGRS